MDHKTVSSLIKKLNVANIIIATTTPDKPAFSVAIQNVARIEEALRQSGLIRLSDKLWVYPVTGWTPIDPVNFKGRDFKALREDFTVRTIDGRIINSFSHENIDNLRRDMRECKLILPSFDDVNNMCRCSFLLNLVENRTYMCQDGGWINRNKLIDTPGGLGIRYYPEGISMDYSKDYCRVRFGIIY